MINYTFPTFEDTLAKNLRNIEVFVETITTSSQINDLSMRLINSQSKVIAIDCETRGFTPEFNHLHGIGLSDNEDINCYIVYSLETHKDIINILLILKENYTVLLHNAKFDLKWLEFIFRIEFTNFEDTMLLTHAINTSEEKALDKLSKKLLGRSPYKLDELVKKIDPTAIAVNKGELHQVGCPITCETCNGTGKVLSSVRIGKGAKYPSSKFEAKETRDGLVNLYSKRSGSLIHGGVEKSEVYRQKKCPDCNGLNYVKEKVLVYPVDFIPLNQLAAYCVEDCKETFLLWQHYQRANLTVKNYWMTETRKKVDSVKTIYELEKSVLPYVKEMEVKGCHINNVLAFDLDNDFKDRLNELKTTLETWVKEFLSDDLLTSNFNIGSHTQLSNFIYNHLNVLDKLTLEEIKSLEKTPSGNYGTGKANIEVMVYLYPDFFNNYLEFSKVKKLQSTYTKLLSTVEIVHTNFNQVGTQTGRISSKNPNILNIPSRDNYGKKIRACFIVPNGYKWLSLDYSQFELRILAYLSNDKKLIKAFKDDIDIHTLVTCLIFNMDYSEFDNVNPEHKRLRTYTKTLNFGIVYGMGHTKLSRMLKISFEDAKNLMLEHRQILPSVWAWMDKLKVETLCKGYCETILGRRRYLTWETNIILDATKEDKKEWLSHPSYWIKWLEQRLTPNDQSNLRIAVNTPIQGSNADFIKQVMTKLWNDSYIFDKGQNKEIIPISQVYDELNFSVNNKYKDLFTERIVKVMESIPKLGDIPIVVTYSIGNNWSEAK